MMPEPRLTKHQKESLLLLYKLHMEDGDDGFWDPSMEPLIGNVARSRLVEYGYAFFLPERGEPGDSEVIHITLRGISHVRRYLLDKMAA